jgi:glycosyltransferase involved in cell wall biosynthesis
MHLITDFAGKGGAQTMLARLLHASDDEKTVVQSLTGVSDYYRSLIDNPNVIFVTEGRRSRLALPATLARIGRTIRRDKPSAVVCWMYHAMVAGSLATALAAPRTPVYWNVRQSLDDTASLSGSTRAAMRAARYLSRFPRGIIYNSHRGKALHEAQGYQNRNSVVIGNGFDLPAFVPAEPRPPRLFGIAGRLHPQKDHETFFRSAAKVAAENSSARFVAAGAGLTRDNPEIRRLLDLAGLPADRVELKGEMDDMRPFYEAIDVLVLSSRTEGFPNVLAEAMGYGKPVVTTDVGDSAVVAGEAGYVVPARDPDSLARAMQSMLALSGQDYARLSSAARLRVEREYSLAAVINRYRSFLKG